MSISQAKLEANRRNAQKSTGPKTDAGKERARFNAVKHGMRAANLILGGEAPDELEARRAAWMADLAPRGETEEQLVDDAVEYTWVRDRARRAQGARIAANVFNAGVDEAKREADDVLRLGQKLFVDKHGPLANYPHYDCEKDLHPGCVPVISHSEILADPEDPPRLVLRLQSTLGGCHWMLDRWAELRTILEAGGHWQSSDKLKAIRLLGRHPLEAVDDRTVLSLLVACQTMESRKSMPIPEIWNELREYERKPYAQRLIGRGIDKLRPASAAAALAVLLEIIDRAIAPIAIKAAEHRERKEVLDSLECDRLAFDESPMAERLRRFDLSCGRGLARTITSLINLRKAKETVVGGQSATADLRWSVVSDLDGGPIRDLTNEPTAAAENLTNEANGAVVGGQSATADLRWSVVSDLDGGPIRDLTNEANAAVENVTNEPTEAPPVHDGVDVKMPDLLTDRDDDGFPEEIAREHTARWIKEGIARMAEVRAALVREMNEGSSRLAAETRAVLRERPKLAKAADRTRLVRTRAGRTIKAAPAS